MSISSPNLQSKFPRGVVSHFLHSATYALPMFIVMQITGLVIATLILLAFIKRQPFR